MPAPTTESMASFLRKQYALWNENKRDEFMTLFRDVARNGLTIEYVGTPPQDGWKAMDKIWDEHGGSTQIEVLELLVNGKEAAVHALNHHRKPDGSTTTSPSIEIYEFGEGTLHARYFYRVS
jgi:hypothetical protein